MFTMKQNTTFLFFFFSFFFFCCYGQHLENKNILLVYGGWEGHQPEAFAKRMSAWLQAQGASVSVTNDYSVYENEESLKKIDLILQYVTMDKLSEAQHNGLTNAVKAGTGIAGCHGGLGDAFREQTEYQYMIGGQFVKHPGGFVNYTVNITNKTDEITKGVQDFSLISEQYYMHVDPALEVLATTQFSGEHDPWVKGVTMPVCWKKQYGKGKVFYLSIGHAPENFDIPEVWTILTNGLTWASR